MLPRFHTCSTTRLADADATPYAILESQWLMLIRRAHSLVVRCHALSHYSHIKLPPRLGLACQAARRRSANALLDLFYSNDQSFWLGLRR